MKTLLRHLALLTLIVTPLLASFENTQRSLLPAKTNTLAPRNGITFDGTATNRATVTLTNQNIGTDPFSVSMLVTVPNSAPTTSIGLFGTSSSGVYNIARGFYCYIAQNATSMTIQMNGATTNDRRNGTVPNFITNNAGKTVHLALVRSSSGLVVYVNGVVQTISETMDGTAPAWTDTITSTSLLIGSIDPTQYGYTNTIHTFSLYNVGLSSSEIRELYEMGGAVPFRYQFGTQVAVLSDNFSSTASPWTDYGSGRISYDSTNQELDCTFTAAGQEFYRVSYGPEIGRAYRMRFTLKNVSAGSGVGWRIYNNTSNETIYTGSFVNGTIDFTFTKTGAGTNALAIRRDIGTGTDSFTIDDFIFNRIGAIVHFPFDEGAGLTAYDQSTNALNATLTATGVSWAQPNRALVTGGNLTVNGASSFSGNGTFGGNLTVSGTGTSSIAGTLSVLTGDGNGSVQIVTGTTQYKKLSFNNSTAISGGFAIPLITHTPAGGSEYTFAGVYGSGNTDTYFYLGNAYGSQAVTIYPNGNTAISGILTLPSDGTSISSGSWPRFNFETNGATNLYSGSTTGASTIQFNFLNRSTTSLFKLYGTGDAALTGNLTVSGTGTHSFNGPVSITGTTASNLLRLTKSGAGSKTFGIDNALDFRIYADNGSTQLFKLTDSGDTTLTGNLTVSGTGGVQLNSLANLTWGGSYGAGIPTIAIPSATSIGFYPTGSTSGKTFELFGTGNATLTGNLTVSGTTGITATDLTLGTSGPSVKSTLSARAPRQGLVFDSSAHGGAPIANQPAFGTSDFTVTAWVNPVAVASNVYILASVADSASLFFTANTVQWIANSSAVISVPGGVVAGKSQLFVVTRSAGTTTYYYNGVAVSTTSSGSGNLANPIVKMGGSASGASGHFNGTISALIYNRALSASEVVALYEAGAPAGADYNSASNTSIAVAATNGNFGGFSSTATSITATSTGSTGYCYIPIPLVKGYKYRIQFTSAVAYSGNSLVWRFLGDPGSGSISGTWSNAVNCTPNAGVLQITSTSAASAEFTPDSSDATAFLHLWEVGITAGSNVSQSGISVTRLGLLLAPDAAQAGGGSVWYDTSGNAANISWTSGVSWNVPSSRVLGGNWTTSGNLTVSGTGTSSFAGSVSIAKVLPTDFGAFSVYNDLGSSATKLEAGVSGSGRGGTYFGQSEANSSIIFSNGTSSNGLLIGSFNAKQVVIGTNNTAAISINGTTQATTLAGNLTVSGTGTSSFASGSKLGVGTTSPGVTFVAAGAPATLNYTIGQTSLADIRSTSAATTNDGPSLTFSGYYQTSLNTSTYGAIKGVLLGAGDGNSAAGALAFLTANTGGVLSEQARLTNLGNFIIGSPFTDAGYKLQVNGSAIIAGPIVSNSATDQKMSFVAAANATYGGANYLRWYRADGTTTRAFFGFGSGNSQVFNLGTEESGDSLQFSTGTNTTALTLDSSQRAQFAGTTDSSSTTTGALTVAGGVGIAKKLYVGDSITITGSNAALFFNSRTGANSNYAWYSPDGTVARLYDNTNAKTLVEFAANTGDATFAGSIRQNQANNISLTSGVATTIFSLGTSAGVYIVTATLDVNAVAGYAIVGKGPTGSWQVLANSGTQISFSMSTNDLQITQSSGATSTTNTFNLLRLR